VNKTIIIILTSSLEVVRAKYFLGHLKVYDFFHEITVGGIPLKRLIRTLVQESARPRLFSFFINDLKFYEDLIDNEHSATCGFYTHRMLPI